MTILTLYCIGNQISHKEKRLLPEDRKLLESFVDKIKNVKYDWVYVSDSSHAYYMAYDLNQRRNYGFANITSHSELNDRIWGDEININPLLNSTLNAKHALGENAFETYNRTVSFYTNSIEPHLDSKNILVLCYDWAFRSLTAHLENEPMGWILKNQFNFGQEVSFEF